MRKKIVIEWKISYGLRLGSKFIDVINEPTWVSNETFSQSLNPFLRPMTSPIFLLGLLLSLSVTCAGQVVINELAATHSDRLLVREEGTYPRVGSTISWQGEGYNDTNWSSGDGPFGFGTSVNLGTDVSAEIENLTPSLYLRKRFNVSAANAASNAVLQLNIRYNDGFIAFLNGVEVARRNMGFPGMFAYRDQPAYLSHNSNTVSTLELGVASFLLQEGENLLCIQVHNESASGEGDLLLDADLRLSGATIVDGGSTWRYFGGLAEPSGGLIDYGLLELEVQGTPEALWAVPFFDDSTWRSAVGPVGYDRSLPPDYLVGLNLIDEMRGVTPSVYVRNRFTVSQSEADAPFPLSLKADFDDGLIVFINGFEVFRDNVGLEGQFTAHDMVADGNRSATGDGGNATDRSLTISLDAARELLVPGENIIAYQLHNASAGSSDLFGEVELRSTGANPRVLVAGDAPLRYFVGVEEPILSDDAEFEILPEPFDSENDWIELRNTSSEVVALDGWSLSDDPSDPRKWSFPDGVEIAANGYFVVAATGLDLSPGADGTTYHHTNFRLSTSGDRIVLTRPDGMVEDQLGSNYPPQSWRYTYGRQDDGVLGYLSSGTPGAANLGPALHVAPAPPEVSIEGGFHPSMVNLTLSTETPGAVIRYTTDGKDPLNGIDYATPISITENTVIRAQSFRSGAIPSAIITHTYLINQGAAFQSLPAMILSGDPGKTFYGPNSSNGPENGEGVFAINGGSYASGTWDGEGEQESFNQPTQSGRAAEKYGAIEYLPLSGDPLRTELGMRAAGSNHTRQRLRVTDPVDGPFSSDGNSFTKFQKPSFNLFFRPEFGERPINYPFFGNNTVTEFDSLRVRAGKNDWFNPFIKDELMRRLFINTGQVGSYGTMHTLWINGVYKGYYNTAERVREGFMQAHYNSEASWDVQQVNSFSSGDSQNWNEMIQYLRTADLSTTEAYAGVHDFLDVDNYIDYLLVNAYAVTGDWPHNNWIAARERSSVGRWRFYVWDAEGAFGFARRDVTTNSFAEQLTLPNERFPSESAMTTTRQYVQAIYTLLKESPEFRLRMADRGQKHLFNGGALETSEVTEVYDELRTEITPIIQETVGVSFRASFYHQWIANDTRYDALLSHLDGEGAWPDIKAPTINQFGGEVSAGFEATLGNPNGGGTIFYTTDGTDPRAPGGGAVGLAYAGAIPLLDDTRLRARVRENGAWGPEIDAEFNLPFANATFLPLASADWTADGNWSSSPDAYPNGDGVTAVVPGVSGDDRNVDLRESVTVGRLIFELEATTSRTRVRDRNSGNTLTFSDSDGLAEIEVTGSDEGFAELEVEAGVNLASDLRVDVQSLEGDSDFGALRLRGDWTGSGGLIKSGPGITSLTGSGKTYTGATVVEQGVLRVTEPAAPLASSSVTVMEGGQLRLVSGTGPNEPARDYGFGGELQLAGEGRGLEILDGGGNGKRGALRYEPGSDENQAVISTPVSLNGPATIHVEGVTNHLKLIRPLSGNNRLTKSGGGTLSLSETQSGVLGAISVDAGTLAIRSDLGSSIDLAPTASLRGHGSISSVVGEGEVILNQTLISAGSSSASRYAMVLSRDGDPVLDTPAVTGNGVMLLEEVPDGVLELDFYLAGEALTTGAMPRGGIVVPASQDLFRALSLAAVRVFRSSVGGEHQFSGQGWTQFQNYRLRIIQNDLGEAAPFEQVKLLELRTGSTDRFEDWRQDTFSSADLADPLISGPQASPFGDGVSNLLRYALGVPAGENAARYLPAVVRSRAGIAVEFSYDGGKDDIELIVESSESLDDWTAATILFDSMMDSPPVVSESGQMRIVDPSAEVQKRFYRVRVRQE